MSPKPESSTFSVQNTSMVMSTRPGSSGESLTMLLLALYGLSIQMSRYKGQKIERE